MNLTRGRVHRAEDAGQVERVPPAEELWRDARGARLDRTVIAAEERARAILSDATRRAEEATERGRAEGRTEGLAQFAAQSLRLLEREACADEASLDRMVELSRLLAERLLGHALSVSPGEIASLARQALDEARGARRVRIHANPMDAEVLARVTAEIDPDGRVHAVVSDEALLRGDLRLETDIGTVHARLGPGLTQLAARLREALRT
jgi:flagellar biosynthesis/type III secretory pathway protein FliH